MAIERALVVFNEDATIKAIATYGADGLAAEATQAELTTLFQNEELVNQFTYLNELVASLTGERDALTVEREQLLADKDTLTQRSQQLEAVTSERDTLREQVRELSGNMPVQRDAFMSALQHFQLFVPLNAFFGTLDPAAEVAPGVTGEAAMLRWNTAQYFAPDEPLLLAIAGGEPFNLTQANMDEMFAWARENGAS